MELAEALHAMPEPMMLIFDLVYGHADNQAVDLLPNRFVSGPNMYGLDLNHQDPSVRAILLEMQRRRMNAGCDGLRIDGAQDFKYYNPVTGEVEHDDAYLQSMSDVVQEIGEHARKPWMIFEDGRPWPREDWPTASTYRDVIEDQPDVWQWGPLIFAHNTPMLEGFWRDKFWRVEQIRDIGGHWISGCGNHDTVRRGTQIETDEPLNTHLGDTLPEIIDAAYDNPAIAADQLRAAAGHSDGLRQRHHAHPLGLHAHHRRRLRPQGRGRGARLPGLAGRRGGLGARRHLRAHAPPRLRDPRRAARVPGAPAPDSDRGDGLRPRRDRGAAGRTRRACCTGPRGSTCWPPTSWPTCTRCATSIVTSTRWIPAHCAYTLVAATSCASAERWTMADCGDRRRASRCSTVPQTVYRGHRVAPADSGSAGTRLATAANMAGPAWEGPLADVLSRWSSIPPVARCCCPRARGWRAAG